MNEDECVAEEGSQRRSRLFHAALEPMTATIELHGETGGCSGRVYTLDGHHPHVLGRDPGCDVPVDPEKDSRASGSHAEIVVSGTQAWIRDLDSRNGTFVNDERVTRPTRLADGDRLTLGRGGPTLRVHLVGPE